MEEVSRPGASPDAYQGAERPARLFRVTALCDRFFEMRPEFFINLAIQSFATKQVEMRDQNDIIRPSLST